MLRRHIVSIALGVLGCVPLAAEAEISFILTPSLVVPRRPRALAAADFNNDGLDDVAVGSSGSNKVTIVLVDKDGNFRQAAALQIGRQLRSIAAGDFNNDGNQDIVVATGSKNSYLVFGAGDGTFSGTRGFRRCCRGIGVVSADIDNANGDDLIFSNPGNNDVSVLTNKGGNAVFNTEKRFGAGRRPDKLVAGDFNADGFLDVAALNTRGGGSDASVYLTVNGGNLSLVANFVTAKRGRMMTIGDLDGDALPDLVVGNPRTNEVSLVMNSGGGFFGSPLIVPFHCSQDSFGTLEDCRLRDVAVADFDGNGIADLAAGLAFPGTSTTPSVSGVDAIDVAPGLGNEVYQVPVRISGVSNGIRAMTLGDFNDDGRTDIAFISSKDTSVRILLNNSTVPPIGPTVTRVVGTATPTLPTGVVTPTPTATTPSGGLTCDTSRGDQDCVAAPISPFCSPTGPGTQGICCDTPCNGANERCDLPGRESTCLPISLPDGEPCEANGQCVSNACAQFFCCDRACNGVTERCDTPGAVGVCLAVSTPTATPTLPGGVTATRTVTPTAVPGSNGADCSNAAQCNSGICEDGVCCASVCAGNQRCDLDGGRGQCLPTGLPNGDPCVSDGQCAANACAQDVCCNRACNGVTERCDVSGAVGTCVLLAPPTVTPTPLPGSNGANCSSAAQCNSGICEDGVCCVSVCVGNQRCDLDGGRGRCLAPDVPNGEVCEAPGQCQSGNCPPDDGVCCNSPCAGPNQHCDLAGARGLCLDGNLPNGSACVIRSQCQSNNCPAAGSVCCSTPCDQPNERCDLQGNVGICVVVTPGQETRTPTATPTRTVPGAGKVTIARGSGCGIAPADRDDGLLALLLVVPLWWWRVRMPLLAKRRRRGGPRQRSG